MICSKCGNRSTRRYPDNTCQKCYKYFLDGGTVNPIPKRGEITYDNRGCVVCHICGRAFTRLGSHVKESHDLTIEEYKKIFELCNKTKTTEYTYSQHMRAMAYKYDMPQRLQVSGRETRIKKGEALRLGRKVRLQERLDHSKRYSNAQNKDCEKGIYNEIMVQLSGRR